MATKMSDIAERLNLSISTVSYALNGGPKPVSREVAKRVQEVARELGYRPNRIARSLVTRRTSTIGVVPADVEANILLTPCIHLALNGIFNAAAKLGQDVLVFTAHDRNLPNEVAEDLLDARVDGVVFIAPRSDSSALRRIAESGLPYAVVAAIEHGGPGFVTDSEAGSLMALEHLFDLGHRRIAHVYGPSYMEDANTRLATYRYFMRGHDLPIHQGFEQPGNYHRADGYEAGLAFANMADRPTAVYCANDDIAFGLIDALRDKGISVPEDISVIGFDDAPIAANFRPPLTTIRQPLEDMSSRAMAAVVDHVQQGVPVQGSLFPPALVIRGSTAPLRKEIIQ